MLISTPGYVLHTTPYAETSVVVKVFTRQLGVKSYIVKGVRSRTGRVKQNLLQPLSCLDMVVYDNPHSTLNYIKEMSHRGPQPESNAIENALRFFMTEVLYKSLHEEEPMPALFDAIEHTEVGSRNTELPIHFLLTVAAHLGIEPMDNYSPHQPYFDLQEGRFVAAPTETTLPAPLSALFHSYLSDHSSNQAFGSPNSPHSPNFQNSPDSPPFKGEYPAGGKGVKGKGFSTNLLARRSLIDALIAYFQLHLNSFKQFHSHEILHSVLSGN